MIAVIRVPSEEAHAKAAEAAAAAAAASASAAAAEDAALQAMSFAQQARAAADAAHKYAHICMAGLASDPNTDSPNATTIRWLGSGQTVDRGGGVVLEAVVDRGFKETETVDRGLEQTETADRGCRSRLWRQSAFNKYLEKTGTETVDQGMEKTETVAPPPEIGTSSRRPEQVGLFDAFQCGCRRGNGRCLKFGGGLPPAGWQWHSPTGVPLCPACYLGNRCDCTCERCAAMQVVEKLLRRRRRRRPSTEAQWRRPRP